MHMRVTTLAAGFGLIVLFAPGACSGADEGASGVSSRPRTIARAMADELYAGSGSPVAVRRDNNVTACETGKDEPGGWMIAKHDALTEFAYAPGCLRATTYTRDDAGDGAAARTPVRHLQSEDYELVHGAFAAGNYHQRRRQSVKLPQDDSAPLDEAALREFYSHIPRALSLDHPGELAAAVGRLEKAAASEQSAAGRGPVSKPRGKEAQSTTPLLAGVLIAAISLTLAGVTLISRARAQTREARRLLAEHAAALAQGGKPASVKPATARHIATRQAVLFPVKSEKDKRFMEEIDGLLNQMMREGMQRGEIETVTKTAKNVHSLAVQEGVPMPLEIVKEYLKDQLEKNSNVIGSVGSSPQEPHRAFPAHARRV